MPFVIMRYQLATESASSNTSTLIPTPSSWTRKFENPRPFSIKSISLQYKVEGLQRNGPDWLAIAQGWIATPGFHRGHRCFVETFETTACDDPCYVYAAAFIQFHPQYKLALFAQSS